MNSNLKLLLFLIFTWFKVNGQDITIFQNHYNHEDGLESDQIYDVKTTNLGYILIATENGIAKFDGESFYHYYNPSEKIENSFFKIIYNQYEDSYYGLSFNGLLTKIGKDSLIEYKGNSIIEQNNLQQRFLSEIFFDKENTLHYSSHFNGYFTIDKNLNANWVVEKDYSQKDTLLNHLFQIEDKLFFVTKNRKHFDNLTPTGSYYIGYINKHPVSINFPEPLNKSPYYELFKTGPHSWLGYYNNWIIELENNQVKLIKRFDFRIISFDFNSKYIAIGFLDNKGIKILDRNNYNEITADLKDLSVSSLKFDHSGGLWATSLNNGLYYSFNPDIKSLYREDSKMVDITNINDSIFILYSDGNIDLLYNDTIRKSYFINNNSPFYWITKFKNKIYLGSRTRNSWYEFNWKNATINNLQKKSSNIIFDPITLVESKDSITIKPFLKDIFSINKKDIDHYDSIIRGNRVIATYGDNKTNILFLSNNKLVVLKKSSFKTIEFRKKIIDIEKLNDSIYIMAVTPNTLWKLNINTNFIEKTNVQISSEISSISIVKNAVYLCTNKGIEIVKNILNQPEKTIFLRENGLYGNYCKKSLKTDDALYILNNDKLTICNNNNIKQVKHNLNTPVIYITNNDTILFSYSNSDQIATLNNNNTLLHIYPNQIPQRNGMNIYYRHTPGSSAFSKTSSNNVLLSNLSPGINKIEVYTELDGVKSEISSISFNIKPKFSQLTIVKVLIGILFLSATFLITRFIVKKRERKLYLESKKREEIILLKLKALRAQINPHFMFNSLNSILYYILNNDPNKAANYLSKFSKLIRQILHHSEEQYISLEEEIDTLKLYTDLEQIRLENKFEYEISSSIQNHLKIKLPALLIQPIIENAIWHGVSKLQTRKGKVTIHFEKFQDQIKVIITDNGVGRDYKKTIDQIKFENEHKSYGVSIITKRLELFNSTHNQKSQMQVLDLKDSDGNPQGTQVTIYLPIIE